MSYLIGIDFKCLPSLVGILSLTASELFQSVCSTDSFVMTHLSKASKGCPVGSTDLGSVSVVYSLLLDQVSLSA